MSQDIHTDSNLSEERERELTEKITLWIGGTWLDQKETTENIFHEEREISVRYYKIKQKRNKPFQNRWKPLSSRDDWAIVEAEIARRGITEKYINALECKLDIFTCLPDDGHHPDDLMKFRVAHPAVCALALGQIIDENNDMLEERPNNDDGTE